MYDLKKTGLLLMTLLIGLSLGACGSQHAETEAAETMVQTEVMTEAAAAAESEEVPAETMTETGADNAAALEDGTYTVDFNTDSSMFHANEAHEGKGILTVNEGGMTLHVSLASKNIVNLFAGTAEEAQKEGAKLLQPTTDTVTYSDGITEEVYGFDIPVPAIDEPFDVALIGTKGVWYDHQVSVSNPERTEETP